MKSSRAIILTALLCVAWLALPLSTGPALAHAGASTALATIVVTGHTVQYRLQFPLTAIPPSLTDAMQPAGPGLPPDYRPLVEAVARNVHVRSEGNVCEAVPGTAIPPARAGADTTVVVHFACATEPGALVIVDDLFDLLGKDHHTIANIQYHNGSRQFVFQPETREVHISVARAEGKWRHRAAGAGAALIVATGLALLVRRALHT